MVDLNETVPEVTNNYSNATEETAVLETNISTSVPTNIITISNSSSLIYYAVTIVAGVLGLLANAAVFALVFFNRNSSKNVCNVLIHNQTAIDFSASMFLVIMFAVKIHGVQLTGSWGRFYCKLFDSNAMYALGINASTAGLMVISFERYTKIVHSVLYRVRFRPWMKYVALVFPWIYSVVITFPIIMATSDISNGRCLSVNYWSADWQRPAYGIGSFIWKFLLPLAVFFFCYTKIMLLIKEQSKVHESRSVNNGPNLLSRSEKNIVKTLLFVVGCFVFSYAPLFFYLLFSTLQMKCCRVNSDSYFITVWISYLNIVINPFIYATKSEIVKTLIRRIDKGKRHMEQTSTVVPYTIDT